MDFASERRLRWLLAAAVCSAVLFSFGTGLAPVAALTWLAPVPVLLLAPRVPAWTAVGVAFGAYFLGTANSWGYQLHSHDEPMFPVGLVINLGMSLTFVFAVWVFRALARNGHALAAAVVTPASWTGVLYVVSVANPMGIMGTFANHQGDQPLVLQTAAVAGMWGVEFLVMFAPSAVAALSAPGIATAARLRTGAVAATVLALALGAGAVRLGGESGSPRRIAVIAANHYQWAPEIGTPAGRELVAGYLHQIDQLPDGVRAVVLPEGAFGSTEALPADLADSMSQAAKSHGTDIVVGLAQSAGAAKYNYALIFPAGGDPVRYLKQHDLVSPPGRDLVFVPSTRTGVEICGDVDFPDPSRDYAAAGGSLLAIPASDENVNGWQHSRTALLRGVENGQSVAWADQNGTLMLSDGWGRVVAEAHTAGDSGFTTVVADVSTGPGATPYTRLGDWFAWLCLALTLGGLAAVARDLLRSGKVGVTG